MATRDTERIAKAGEPPGASAVVVYIVGRATAVADQVSPKIEALLPEDWQLRRGADFDQTISDRSPLPALIILACDQSSRLDPSTLKSRVEWARGVPVALAGNAAALPDEDTCLRAGIAQRIDLDDADDLIDLHVKRMIQQARQRYRLLELESHRGHATAWLEKGLVRRPSPFFARLIGAKSLGEIESRPIAEWLNRADAARLNAACKRLAGASQDAGCAVVLRRARDGGTQPLSVHLRVDAKQRRLWLSLAPIDATSMPILDRAPIPDARMALHQHLASISRWSDTGRLRGLIFVAVDESTELQATFGLANADRLLQSVGVFLIEQIEKTDRCFRFAPGEYAISVERNTPGDVSELGRQLAEQIPQREFGDAEHSVHLHASVCTIMLAAEAVENDRRLQQLMETAHQLQAAGGDDYRECESSEAASPARANEDEWQAKLERALAGDRFRLAFQTVTSLAGDQQSYYDVLLRYLDDQGEMILPGEFLPAAADGGLMPEIDRWVARRAARMIAEQAARNVQVVLFVKLSRETLGQAQAFTVWLEEEPAFAEVQRSSLIFCVREGDARTDMASMRRLSARLDRLGFRVALSHFGESSSHTAMLTNLPLSFLKLAPAFSSRVVEHAGDDKRLQQTIDYAREHRIPMVAERIEDAESMAQLWQAGVNYVQGHFIQEPDVSALRANS